MSSPTTDYLKALSVSAQGFVPESEARRPSTFLSLAPATSASYPTQPRTFRAPSTQPSAPSPKADASVPPAAAAAAKDSEEIAVSLVKHRRSSSLTSDSSTGSAGKPRFLKLGPVHWGVGDGTGDWSEVVTE